MFELPVLAVTPDPVSAGAFLLFLGVALFAMLVFSAIFIHVAAGMLGFAQTFGTAIRAVLLQIVYVIVFTVLFAIASLVVPVLMIVGPFLAQWIGAGFGIRQAYSINFFRALLAAVLSVILSFVFSVVVVVIVALVAGFSVKQLQDEIQKHKQPTISAELEPAPATRSSIDRYSWARA